MIAKDEEISSNMHSSLDDVSDEESGDELGKYGSGEAINKSRSLGEASGSSGEETSDITE